MDMVQKRMISYICFSPMRVNSAAILRKPSRSLAPAPGIDAVLGEGIEPRRIRRRHHQQRLDEAALPADLRGVMVIGLGVLDRMPAQQFPRPVMIAIGDDAFAVRVGLAVDLIGDDLQPVAGQIEEAEDLGPQQAADIGAGGIGEAGIDLVRHRRPAGLAVALEHQDLQLVAAFLLAAHGEIGRRRQPVMPAAHDDDVIGLAHARSAPKKLNARSIYSQAGLSLYRGRGGRQGLCRLLRRPTIASTLRRS